MVDEHFRAGILEHPVCHLPDTLRFVEVGTQHQIRRRQQSIGFGFALVIYDDIPHSRHPLEERRETVGNNQSHSGPLAFQPMV